MGMTPQYKLPYPELSDTPDVPRDMKALALATDAGLKSIEDQVDAAIIGFEIQSSRNGHPIRNWFQMGDQSASRWDTVWWASRWPGGEAALKNGSSPGVIDIPYTGLWKITCHFECPALGNSTWICSVDVPPTYSYGNSWAWLWDMKINHGMVSGREYFITKGTKLAFHLYCRDSNGATGGTSPAPVFLRVIGRFVGPREGQPMLGPGTPLPPVPHLPNPDDPAQNENVLPTGGSS